MKARQVTAIQEKDGVTLTLPDGTSRFFHYVWLRMCCRCDVCGHGYEGTLTLQPCDVPLDIQPVKVRCSDGKLDIAWSTDRHESQYDVPWLFRNAYAKEDREYRKHRPTLWNREIFNTVPAVDYQAVREDNEHYMTLLRSLRDYGFVIVRDGPQDIGSGETMAGLLGEIAESTYGRLFDLNPSSNNVTFGNTMNTVPPHTDEAYLHSPPGINVLHCLRPANKAGESVLVDGFHLAEQLRLHDPQHFEVLTTIPQSYHRIVQDLGIYHNIRGTVIKLDSDDDVVGFRYHTRTAAPLDVPTEDVIRVHAANAELSRRMLEDDNQACFKLQSGEAVFFDNHRVMHARKAFSDPHRHMQISAVSRAQFHRKLRMTAYKLGYRDEAEQLLASGAG